VPIADRVDRVLGATVGDVMVRDVLVAHPQEGVADLLTVLRSADVRSLPVVDDGVVVGVATWVSRCRVVEHALDSALDPAQ
jgi:predicted transcriptional regulator